MKRVRTKDGFYRDELPRAGPLMKILIVLFSFVIGGLVGIGAFFWTLGFGPLDFPQQEDSVLSVWRIFGAFFFIGGLIGALFAVWALYRIHREDETDN